MQQSPREHANVMVIDASPGFRALVVDVLRTMGVKQITQAGEIAQALEVLPRVMPNVILLDWAINDAVGIEFVKRLRRGAAGVRRDTPVIMVTSRKDLGDVEAARAAGVDEYLIKPVSTANLTARIDAVLFKRREFIQSANFVGPARRRRRVDIGNGDRRSKNTA